MKTVMLIIMFFLIGAFFIISENNLKLSEHGNFDKAVRLYSEWFSTIFDNSKSLTGYIVKMNWLPENNDSSG